MLLNAKHHEEHEAHEDVSSFVLFVAFVVPPNLEVRHAKRASSHDRKATATSRLLFPKNCILC